MPVAMSAYGVKFRSRFSKLIKFFNLSGFSTMSIFRRADYTSEITQFIEQMKTDRPELEAEQRAGMSIWWNKILNRAEQSDYEAGRIAQKGYVYGTTGHDNSR